MISVASKPVMNKGKNTSSQPTLTEAYLDAAVLERTTTF
jgi:hypothetical protein